MPNRPRFSGAYFAFAVLASSLLFSCGLPTYIYLYPPSDFYSSGDTLMVLVHNDKNYDSSEGSSQSFKGYDIYYRAYDSYLSASSAYSTLISKAYTYADAPDSFMNWALGVPFVRLRTEGDNLSPLISLSATEAQSGQTYHLNLNDTDLSNIWTLYNAEDTATPIVHTALRRNIPVTSRSAFTVSSNYQNGDDDYSGATSPTTVYFVFFAVAYGWDDPNFTDVCSIPAYDISKSYITYTPPF